MIRAGELNKRIDLLVASKAPTGTGGFTTTWTTVATVWAAIWPVSAGDRVTGDKMTGEITHKVRIRYRDNVTSAMKIKHGNKTLAIIGPPINPNMRNEWLDLTCKEAA